MALTKYTYRPKEEVPAPEIEYTMNKEQFDAIAETRGNKNTNPYIYVIEYINETFGLLGTVTALSVEGDFPIRGQRAKVGTVEYA